MAKEMAILEAPASIPQDIIIDCLVRLPVKSLLRFESVCKTWYDMIKNPNFISMHHNFATTSRLLICERVNIGEDEDQVWLSSLSNDKSMTMLSPSPDFIITERTFYSANERTVCIAGSCNGIVCYFKDYESIIFLCNPATRKSKMLPPCSFQSGSRFRPIGVGFAFDAPNLYNFKVLTLFHIFEPGSILRAGMYTSSSNTWRQLDWILDDSDLYHTPSRHAGLFCANSFHWMVVQHRLHKEPPIIVCCDIHTEIFTTFDLPRTVYGDGDMMGGGCEFSLGVYKEFLSVVQYLFYASDIVIWIMKDHGVEESWTKLYSIPQQFKPVGSICFWMDDHALLLHDSDVDRLTHTVVERLVSLNLSTLEFENTKYNDNSQVIVYRETLVPII